MIFDGISYEELLNHSRSALSRFYLPLVRMLEAKLGISAMYAYKSIPWARPDLFDPAAIAGKLQQKGIVKAIICLSERMPDEPPLKIWSAVFGDEKNGQASGAAVENDSAALYGTLAEALERYIWSTQNDYFARQRSATVLQMQKSGWPYIAPEQFVSFSSAQRKKSHDLSLDPGTPYLWIRGLSLITGRKVLVPAQTVSATVGPRSGQAKEPLIRLQTTNGLATWPTKAGARLAGALELIERDAFMITWFNQLTMPRIALNPLRERSSTLDLLLKRCERYRLRVHAIQMATDAPTHAICAVVEDLSGHAPRYSVGLRAHRNLAYAIEKAALEALRMRRVYRDYFASGGTWDANTPVDKIGHRERLYYWGEKDNAAQLDFLVQGEEKNLVPAEWEQDTEEDHLAHVIAWCKKEQYECVSVSLGTSATNPTRWHVEMVLMPDLQPIHLMEWRRHLGGERLKKIPLQFGYTPRTDPFIAAPHPFC